MSIVPEPRRPGRAELHSHSATSRDARVDLAQNEFDAPLTSLVAEHIRTALTRETPPEVAECAKQHVLDGLIAIISGSQLRPGRLAAAYAISRASQGRASIAGTSETAAPELAALANGMSAHADESDDGSDVGGLHPAASIVPAAVALGEDRDTDGRSFLRAVLAGYDVGASINIAAWGPSSLRTSIQSTHGLGQLFGAAAAAAAIAELSHRQIRYVLSYCAQRASGLRSYGRDTDHVEKAFAMGGKQAHDAVSTITMVEAGFSGVDDILDGSPNLFDVWGADGQPRALIDELRSHHHVLSTDIKLYPIGMPLQAAAEAIEVLLRANHIPAKDAMAIVCQLPAEKAHIVDRKPMPDVNCQYVLAVMLIDGKLTFGAAHDYERLWHDPAVADLMKRVELVGTGMIGGGDPDRTSLRTATVEIMMRDGRRLTSTIETPRGNHRNPASWSDLTSKAHSILSEALSVSEIDRLIERTREIETMSSVRDIRSFLVGPVRAGTTGRAS
jgi:2-methylcitrate dehydratase PrpD